MLSFEIGNTRVSVSVLFMALLCVAAAAAPTGALLAGICAAASHEVGHILALRKAPQSIVFSAGGVCMRCGERRTPLQMGAGILANLALAALFFALWRITGAAVFWPWFAANAVLAALNAVPAGVLDGAGLLQLFLLRFFSPGAAARIGKIISYSAAAALLCLGMFCLLEYRSAMMLVFAIYVLLSVVKGS